jgi:hypothetical protein
MAALGWLQNLALGGSDKPTPVVTPVGGWFMHGLYDRYRDQHRQGEEESRKAKEAISEIEDETDAEIARLLHKKLDYEARTKEIEALEAMVSTGYTARQAQYAREYNERVALAYEKAAREKTFAALEKFEREMEHAIEEEEFLLLALMMLE